MDVYEGLPVGKFKKLPQGKAPHLNSGCTPVVQKPVTAWPMHPVCFSNRDVMFLGGYRLRGAFRIAAGGEFL
jgi:hypothetical protein